METAKPKTPPTSFEFIRDWFAKAAQQAKSMGKRDSAALWEDGLFHLENLKEQRDELLAALKEVVAIADRKTVEFDRARAAIEYVEAPQ